MPEASKLKMSLVLPQAEAGDTRSLDCTYLFPFPGKPTKDMTGTAKHFWMETEQNCLLCLPNPCPKACWLQGIDVQQYPTLRDSSAQAPYNNIFLSVVHEFHSKISWHKNLKASGFGGPWVSRPLAFLSTTLSHVPVTDSLISEQESISSRQLPRG